MYWVCVCVFCTLSSVQSVNMYCVYVNCFCFFCTVWSTLSRISLTKALVLWWCDNKSDLIWWWAELNSFKHDVWNWGSLDQRILLLKVWGSFRCFYANTKCVFMCLHWREDWVLPHHHKAQIDGVLQWCLSFCRFLLSPHMIMELN